MTEATTAAATAEPAEPQTPAAAGSEPATPAAPAAKPTLEESLAALDETTRAFVLGEVRSARDEAKGLRTRLKEAEPKISEYDRLVEASKTAEQRAQEAAQAAEQRATDALRRLARARVETALTGLVDQPAAIIDDLDLSRFLGDDGEVDNDRVDQLRQKYAAMAAAAAAPRQPRPDASQASGANGGGSSTDPRQMFAGILQSAMRQPGSSG